MQANLDLLLDECLTLLREGRTTIDECLARYPALAAELKPLLESAEAVRRMASPAPTRTVFEAGKERMLAAVHRQYARPQAWFGLFGAEGRERNRRTVLVPALALLLVAAVSLFLYLASQGSLVFVRPANPPATSYATPTLLPPPTAAHGATTIPEPTERPAPPLASVTQAPTGLPPTPTFTPAPTELPEATASRTPSPTPTPTEPPEATEPPSPTRTPAPTESPEGTESPEPTHSPAPTEPPEGTESPEPTHPPEPTHSPEPTWQRTPTPTPTHTPSVTPSPTHTPTPTTTARP